MEKRRQSLPLLSSALLFPMCVPSFLELPPSIIIFRKDVEPEGPEGVVAVELCADDALSDRPNFPAMTALARARENLPDWHGVVLPLPGRLPPPPGSSKDVTVRLRPTRCTAAKRLLGVTSGAGAPRVSLETTDSFEPVLAEVDSDASSALSASEWSLSSTSLPAPASPPSSTVILLCLVLDLRKIPGATGSGAFFELASSSSSAMLASSSWASPSLPKKGSVLPPSAGASSLADSTSFFRFQTSWRRRHLVW
mmetsp:Transcript_19233/g.40862  ORF Transcript_19233/g.40862 Transcript_19233/m.40862 type:complete len:253 (-) Transcript_19233:74-832(-)